jgi:hypothetical protein
MAGSVAWEFWWASEYLDPPYRPYRLSKSDRAKTACPSPEHWLGSTLTRSCERVTRWEKVVLLEFTA